MRSPLPTQGQTQSCLGHNCCPLCWWQVTEDQELAHEEASESGLCSTTSPSGGLGSLSRTSLYLKLKKQRKEVTHQSLLNTWVMKPNSEQSAWETSTEPKNRH